MAMFRAGAPLGKISDEVGFTRMTVRKIINENHWNKIYHRGA